VLPQEVRSKSSFPDWIVLQQEEAANEVHELTQQAVKAPRAASAALLKHDQIVALLTHLGLLAGRLILDGDQSIETHSLAQDLHVTLEWSTEDAPLLWAWLGSLTSTLNRTLGNNRYNGARLLTSELDHAARYLLSQADQKQVAVHPDLQVGGAVHLMMPEAAKISPLNLTLVDLLPPSTKVRVEREAALLEALDEGTEYEQYAAALLLWVNARDRLEVMNPVEVLEYAGSNLIAAEGIRNDQGLPLGPIKQLRSVAEDLRAELEYIEIVSLRSKEVIPEDDRSCALSDSSVLLRSLRVQYLEGAGLYLGRVSHYLWDVFDELDKALETDHAPKYRLSLRVMLILYGLYALVSLPRAPGMPTTLLVEIVTSMSGINPLWEWKACAKDEETALRLSNVFMEIFQFFPNFVLLEEEETAIKKVMSLLGGKFFLLAKDLKIQLPYVKLIRQYFQNFGPQHFARLTPKEDQILAAEINRLNDLRSAYDQRPHSPEVAPSPPQEEPLETEAASSPPPVRPEPVHLQEARELLRGRQVTLLGSLPNEKQREALMRTLNLGALDWISADEYQHGQHAYSRVRPNTDLVILIVTRMGHAHNGLHDVARDRGVPCVMHPGGPSPSSVAYSVMCQVSAQLRKLS